MSNERRHELEKNDLAILLDRVTKTLEPYGTAIALGIGALLVVGIGWLFYNSEQHGDRSIATLELIQGAASQDAEVLMDVSDRYAGTAAASWAKVYEGQLQLSQGIQSLYTDRELAQQRLTEAKTAFESAIAKETDPLLRSRAYLGIARAEESLGNLPAATKAYEQVASIGESKAMIKQAEGRIEALANPQTKEFLVWFNDQNFAPADPSLPPSMPGLDSLPDMPELSLSDQLPGGESNDGGLSFVDGTEVMDIPDDDSSQAPLDGELRISDTSDESSDPSGDPEPVDAPTDENDEGDE